VRGPDAAAQGHFLPLKRPDSRVLDGAGYVLPVRPRLIPFGRFFLELARVLMVFELFLGFTMLS
jgi:hypothetical protein